jgi:(S)-mandelate dehydrogenase
MARGLDAAVNIEDLRAGARRRLPRAIFDFFDGGAEDETTLRANRAAFERVRLAPRVLVDVSAIDTTTTLLGAPAALPLAVAPMGAIGFGRRGGDLEIARVAQRAGIPYALSTSATASIERVAAAVPEVRRWFQAYILRQRAHTMALVERAAAAGYDGLIVTVDLPVGGKRERDARNDFAVPFRFTARNLAGFAARPAWAASMLLRGVPVMENVVGLDAQATSASAVASSVGRGYDASFDWAGLAAMRAAWRGQLILKGVVRADDARRAVDAGCDAIVVSNHGGRQLDGGVATLDALPAVVAAVGEQACVMVDGGVRRGVDVLKALALGARTVLVGRALLYGVAAFGEPGAARALEILRTEFVRAMQLCGARSIAEITPDLVHTSSLRAGGG